MTAVASAEAELQHSDRIFIDGAWTPPATTARVDVFDSATEQLLYQVAEAHEDDMSRAISAARAAFDRGPWPQLSHRERAGFLEAFRSAIETRADQLSNIWSRQMGILNTLAHASVAGTANTFSYYAALADDFPFVERHAPSSRAPVGLLVREPVGVVGAIIPWNAPIALISYKIAPALLAGCTVVLKASPEAPGEAYVMAEIADEIGLPPGVLNVVTAHRGVSELLVRDPRVDKITFTGSTAAGRRIASLCGERIARCTLELGGKSAAVVLDDYDIGTAARALANQACYMSGQVCASLTRIVVSHARHDDLVEALSAEFAAVRVGSPFDPRSTMGPLVNFAILFKIHHAAIDGVAGAELLTATHACSPDEPVTAPTEDWSPRGAPSGWGLLARAAANNLRRPVRAVRSAVPALPSPRGIVKTVVRRPHLPSLPTEVPVTRFNGSVTAHRTMDARSCDLDRLKRIKNVIPGATVNDVALSVVGGALRSYLQAHDELPKSSLIAAVPISTRLPGDENGGNRISLMMSPLGTDIADAVERVAVIAAATAAKKDRMDAARARAIADVTQLIPGAVVGVAMRRLAPMISARRPWANVVVTNVPGPPVPLYAFGSQMFACYGMGPILDGLGIIHLVGSYAGKFTFSFTACREMVPDPALYADHIQEALDELTKATG
jgi:aldehyde dehydrogenase (NAD+)